MWKLVALGIGFIVLSAVLQRLVSRVFGVRIPISRRPGERFIVQAFTLITLPLVVLIWLTAALWLLPYILLSKPYRLHLREARRSRQAERVAWSSVDPFSRQLGSLDVLDFLRLPYAPVFAFLDWLDRRPRRGASRSQTEVLKLTLQDSSREGNRRDPFRSR
jgi:hypothetical protein